MPIYDVPYFTKVNGCPQNNYFHYQTFLFQLKYEIIFPNITNRMEPFVLHAAISSCATESTC